MKHRWPRQSCLKSSRSIGSVEIIKCNNCLACKLVFTTHDKDGNETVTEQIVVPTNNRAYPEAIAAGECVPQGSV